MKRYLLLTLPLFFLFSGQAGAVSLQDTQQYRALDNYVFSLEERQDSIASNEDKEIYREQLMLRRDVTNERLRDLRDARFSKAAKKYERAKRKALRSLKSRSNKRRSNARDSYRSSIAKAEGNYREAMNAIADRYGREIKELSGKIKALRKKLKATKDPGKRIEIGNTINSLQGALNPLKEAAARESKKAKSRLLESKNKAERTYERALDDIARDFKRDWGSAKRKAFNQYQNNRKSIQATVGRERASVTRLYERGIECIRNMPEPQAKKKAKKSKRGR